MHPFKSCKKCLTKGACVWYNVCHIDTFIKKKKTKTMHPFNLPRFALAIFILLAAIILLTLISCSKYTELAATKDVNRAYVNHPKVVAKIARDAFPCIPTKDTTIIIDSAKYKQWKNSTDSIVKSYEDFVNSLTPEVIVDSANCEENEAILKRNINYYKSIVTAKDGQIKALNIAISNSKPIVKEVTLPPVKDMADIEILNDALLKSVNETAKQKDYGESLEAKVAQKNKWLLYILIALLASLGVNYLQFKRK